MSSSRGQQCGAVVLEVTTTADHTTPHHTSPHHTSSVVISQSDHCRPQDEPGERLPSEMSELQEDGGQGEGDEEKGGEAGQVGERRDLIRTSYYDSHVSWSQEKASRKAAIRQIKKQLKPGITL